MSGLPFASISLLTRCFALVRYRKEVDMTEDPKTPYITVIRSGYQFGVDYASKRADERTRKRRAPVRPACVFQHQRPQRDSAERREEGPRAACPFSHTLRRVRPLSTKPNTTFRRQETHFRPRSAFCSSMISVRIDLPSNWPLAKVTGRPIKPSGPSTRRICMLRESESGCQ